MLSPKEPPRRVPGVPAAWPFLDQGVTFENVVLRYAPDLEPVLRGVSFHVKVASGLSFSHMPAALIATP